MKVAFAQLVPLLHAKFEALDEASADVLQGYFEAYGRAVRANADLAARDAAARSATPGSAMFHPYLWETNEETRVTNEETRASRTRARPSSR